MEPSRAPIRLLTRPAAQNPLGPAQAAEQEAMYQQLLQQQQIEEEEQEAKLHEQKNGVEEKFVHEQQHLTSSTPQLQQTQQPLVLQTQQQQQQQQQQSLPASLLQTPLPPQQQIIQQAIQQQQQQEGLSQESESPFSEQEELASEQVEGPDSGNGSVLAVEGVDAMVLDALTNGRDRVTVIKFDQQCCHFLKERRKLRLEFPNLSSYHRLLIHRIADYYLLAHNVEGGLVQPTVVLTRTEHSRSPAVRLCDLIEKEDELLPQPQQVTMIMKRTLQKTSPRLTAFAKGDGTFPKEEVLIQQRELEYEKARAMIFDERRSSPPEPPNRKTVELLDQIMPSSRDPEAVDKKRMIEPQESHLYNRRLYAPTFPHYQPHWYPEPRLRDCWQPFQRPPVRLREADFTLDTSPDSFPPLGKDLLDADCLLAPGNDGEMTVTSLAVGTPSWSPPWAFPSPLLTAETAANNMQQQQLQQQQNNNNISSKHNSQSPPSSPSSLHSLPQSTSPSRESSCSLPAFASSFSSPLHSPSNNNSSSTGREASTPSVSSPPSPSSSSMTMTEKLSQLSLFSDPTISQSFLSPLPSASTETTCTSSSSLLPPSNAKPLPSQKLPRTTTTRTATTSSSSSLSSITVIGGVNASAPSVVTTIAAAAMRAKKKPGSVARAVPRASPRSYPPGSAPPALLSTASFQSFAPAPFASTPGPYYPSPAHRHHNPSPSRHQPNSSLSPSNHTFYPPSSSFYSLPPQHQPPKSAFPFPITAASWTSEMLPAKPRPSPTGGNKPSQSTAQPQTNKKGPKAGVKTSELPLTMHVAKPNTFVPRVQTDEESPYSQPAFTPRRAQGAEEWNKYYAQEGGQGAFSQGSSFTSNQPYEGNPYPPRPSPSFNPSQASFTSGSGYSTSASSYPSQPYPSSSSFAPPSSQATRYTAKNLSASSQQYASSSFSSQQQGNFTQSGAYPSSSPHAYPAFNPQQQQQHEGYPSYGYQNGAQQYSNEFTSSNFTYKQQQQQQQQQHTHHSPSPDSNTYASNNYQGEGYDQEQAEQQPQQQQQYQQYPMYASETGYPSFSQGGW